MTTPDVPDDGPEREFRAFGDAGGGTPPQPAGPGWPELPPLEPGLVVPDDASELDLDVQALRREQRAASRTARVDRLFVSRRDREHRISGFVVVLVLVVVAGFGALLTLLGPARSLGPASAPLATTASGTAGSVGGLLPETSLDLGSGPPLDARLVRPAVIVLVPVGCTDCTESIRAAVQQANEFRLRSLLVAPRTLSAEEQVSFDALVRAISAGIAIPATDSSGTLARAYAPAGVSVVVVASDGVVAQVIRNVTPQTRLEPLLARIAFPGATP